MKPTKQQAYPLLFQAYKNLAENVDWLDLNLKPAPVHQLKNLGDGNIWIKRNDCISTVIGGNKVRRLEFILADVIKNRKNHVVTLGGIGSNHCLAVAQFCRLLGLRCTLCLFEQPVTQYVQESLLMYHSLGAELVYAGGVFKSALRYYLGLKWKYPHAYFIESGGASEIGVLGAINGALEFSQQVKQGLSPEPDYVFCPTASNGGLAGLILGFQLAGLKSTVFGVRTGRSNLGPFQLNTPQTVRKKIKSTYSFLSRFEDSLPPINYPESVLIEGYFGDGYGFPTEKGKKAMRIFEEKEGIRLEPVYTAKTCAAILDRLHQPSFKDKVILYWHTYHSVDLTRATNGKDYHDLPSDFHIFFENKILDARLHH